MKALNAQTFPWHVNCYDPKDISSVRLLSMIEEEAETVEIDWEMGRDLCDAYIRLRKWEIFSIIANSVARSAYTLGREIVLQEEVYLTGSKSDYGIFWICLPRAAGPEDIESLGMQSYAEARSKPVLVNKKTAVLYEQIFLGASCFPPIINQIARPAYCLGRRLATSELKERRC